MTAGTRRKRGRFPLAVLAVAVALCMTAPASAVIIPPTDYDTIVGSVGGVVDTASGVFQFGPSILANLDTTVYFDGSVYTYEHDLAAETPSVSEFNTLFDVLGFNGVAGWSFTDALAAGSPGGDSAFTIDEDPDGTIDYETNVAAFGFGDGDRIRFFFQSSAPPNPASYGLINSGVDSTTTLGPTVPEPGTILLLGTALLGIGLIRKRRQA